MMQRHTGCELEEDDDYFCLFGERDADLEEEDEEEEEQLELESDRGDLLRYLLFCLPLTGLGGGVGSVHGAALASPAPTSARPAGSFVLGFSERCCDTHSVCPEGCVSRAAAALESTEVTCKSLLSFEASLSKEGG